MNKAVKNLPPWRDCDHDWDVEFEKFLSETRTIANMVYRNAKIYKDAVLLTQKNIKGEWESLT